jgi:hypothetical protein
LYIVANDIVVPRVASVREFTTVFVFALAVLCAEGVVAADAEGANEEVVEVKDAVVVGASLVVVFTNVDEGEGEALVTV